MSDEFFFQTDAAIIQRLGRELVARQDTALSELIKNAYDADATNVEVTFDLSSQNHSITVSDNGSGMSKSELVDGFLRLASGNKVSSPFSEKFSRRRAGKKGIGRLAANRLGDYLILETRSKSEECGWKLTVDWRKFCQGAELNEVPVRIVKYDRAQAGTTLRVEKLFDQWSDATIKRAFRNIIRLQTPFPVAPVEDQPRKDPGFEVKFIRDDNLFNEKTEIVNIETELLQYAQAVVELSVDDDGNALWRWTNQGTGLSSEWKKIHHEALENKNPHSYANLRKVWMKTYYFILLPNLYPSMVFSRVKEELTTMGGVRLYRNGFRVVPYGEPDNDWLRLDELYAKRSFLAPIANRNYFGVVEVKDTEGTLFEEHTSREGLVETPAVDELRNLISSVLITVAGQISEERGKKTRASDKQPQRLPDQEDTAGKLKLALAGLRSATSNRIDRSSTNSTDNGSDSVAENIDEVENLAEVLSLEVAKAKAEMADEAAMLRLLATLGMTTAEFSHETGMTFDAFRFDFEAVFKVAVGARSGDHEFATKANRAKTMLDRLDALTSYLNALASSRSAREVRPVSLTRIVESFKNGVAAQANSASVDLEVSVPPYDPLFTCPIHEAELASVLLNLYTNAVKAMKRAASERRVLIEVSRLSEEQLEITFSDTGDGIAEENKERIFDPFFTTRTAPPGSASDIEHARGTGLGLWIVHQIVENVNGEICVIDPKHEYSTTFQILIPAEE